MRAGLFACLRSGSDTLGCLFWVLGWGRSAPVTSKPINGVKRRYRDIRAALTATDNKCGKLFSQGEVRDAPRPHARALTPGRPERIRYRETFL